ncbi:deoxyribonuclease-2-alpha [Ischnura elegans]|uniref:deoxyribonuclease-2-alpha n=1 Tax=Ischnura elegans TaxID=197161 RepID=UPI001ED894BD|nr:deoxyribonuclease-2-alpha [Ischnura elegans]
MVTALRRSSSRRIRMMNVLIFTFLTILFLVSVTASQQCVDEDGDNVDWYVMYKLPRQKESDNEREREGLAYMYITSRTLDTEGWRMSSLSIGDEDSIPGRTLAPVVHSENMAQDLLWLLYNDQPPNSSKGGVVNVTSSLEQGGDPPTPDTTKYGHTKGAVLTDGETGFWLVHSVPHFLDVTSPKDREGDADGPRYSYPATGEHFGQSFLCITLEKDALEEVGRQLTYNEPMVYAFSVPDSLSREFPELSSAARENRVTSSPWFRQAEITSVGGRKFLSFAKAGSFGKELYGDWVATALRANLLVESWRNGRGKLDSLCNRPHWVENVASIGLGSTTFKTTQDHSKWAVADEEEGDGAWTCVGDINRMESQEERGGGTVCTEDALLWKAYRNSIKEVEACPIN